MTSRLSCLVSRLSFLGFLFTALGCSSPDASLVNLPSNPTTQSGKEEPPVAVNPDVPVEYPAALFNQRIEGRVLLRLYADSTGKLDEDSTRIAESSGYPAFDSAAVVSARQLRFAPARRDGQPVGMSFTQPINFRHPQRSGTTP